MFWSSRLSLKLFQLKNSFSTKEHYKDAEEQLQLQLYLIKILITIDWPAKWQLLIAYYSLSTKGHYKTKKLGTICLSNHTHHLQPHDMLYQRFVSFLSQFPLEHNCVKKVKKTKKVGFCILRFCLPTKRLHLNASFFPLIWSVSIKKVTKMLDNASHTDAFNAKTTLGGKTTTYTSSWFS